MSASNGAGDRIFLIPSADGRFLVYAPLGNFVARVDGRAAAMIRDSLRPKSGTRLPADTARDLGNLEWVAASAAADPEAFRRRRFRPSMATLFPTNRCNLDCLYCYADAGHGAKTLKMAPEVAQAAIRFAARNAVKNGEREMRLGFHGGGEPMIEKAFVQECVGYARRVCEMEKLSLRLVGSTNGCLDESTMEWMASVFNSLSLSCDGPESIQNLQRPFPKGKGSWETLDRNVKILRRHNVQFGVRVTLTDKSVARAADIVRFFIEQWNVFDIHLEPLYEKGRGRGGPLQPPSPEAFIAAFKDAFAVCKAQGARLQYSGTRLGEVHSSFCEVDGQSFSVTPDGHVTACFEVTDGDKPGRDVFFYGAYHPGRKRFVFDKKKLRALRALSLETKQYCKNCFCRWNCAGDCPAKCPRLAEQGIAAYVKEPGARCEINRAITRFLLEDKLDSCRKPESPGGTS